MEVGNLTVKLSVDDVEFRNKLLQAQQLLSEFETGLMRDFGNFGLLQNNEITNSGVEGMMLQFFCNRNGIGKCDVDWDTRFFCDWIWWIAKTVGRRDANHVGSADARKHCFSGSGGGNDQCDASGSDDTSECIDGSSGQCGASGIGQQRIPL